jgi:hypothetical protein
VVLLAACQPAGKLILTLDLPAAQSGLSPMEDPRLHHFTLMLQDDQRAIEHINSVPFYPEGRTLGLGNVPVGRFGKITLIGYTASGQVMAFGSAAPPSIDGGAAVDLGLPLRKPFTYLAGASAAQVFDTSQSHAEDIVPPIGVGTAQQAITAVATTPDGRHLLAAVADRTDPPPPTPTAPMLAVFATWSHAQAYTVPLTYRPDHLAVSPDGAWAVISSTGENWVTFVNLAAVLAGGDPASATRDVVLAAPSRAAFVQDARGATRVVILRDRQPLAGSCSPAPTPSTLTTFDLAQGSLLNSTTLSSVAADLAGREGDTRVYVAHPCNGIVSAFDTASYSESVLTFAQLPASLVANGDTLYVGGVDLSPDSGRTRARAVVTAIDLDTAAEKNTVSGPAFDEGFALADSSTAGRNLVVTVQPDQVHLYALSLPPGGSRISALAYVTYVSEPFPVTIDGVNRTVTGLRIASYNYLGIDATSGEIRRRYRTACTVRLDATPETPRACTQNEAHEQPDAATGAFVPLHLASLYGAP